MFQRGVFADANSGVEEAEFAIVGYPFDSTASFRPGSRGGPDAVRMASYNFETYDFRHGVDLAELKIADLGNVDLGSDPVYAWKVIRESFFFIPGKATPVFIGGEHSITPPIVKALSEGGNLGVLVLDAHLDLREEYGATRLSHACASRRVLDQDGLEGYASIGIRSGSREEFAYAREREVPVFTSDDVHRRGIEVVLEEALEKIDCERLYLSIDFDAIDPAYAPGVGNPEPFGLTPWDVRTVVERVAPLAVAMDVNEISPAYDLGQTAILGARLIREYVACKAAKGP